MCHTPSSSPDDEPTEDFDCEFGCQPMDHGIGIDAHQEAAMRYIQARYTEGEITPTEVQAEIIKDIEVRAAGIYDKMVHRETDGSDPLVQEPKGKP